MKLLWYAGCAALALASGVVTASAQPVISAKSGTIALVEGKVYLNDQLVEPSLTKFPDIKENGVVRTEEGRTEVLLTPGVSLHLGENASFRLVSNRLIDTRLELLTGSAVVDALEIAKDTNVTVVCKEGTVAVSKAGHFRFDTNPARIKVFAGVADVTLKGEHLEVPAAKMLSLSGDSATVEKFDREETDSLDNWARRRGEEMAVANVSAAKHTYDTYGSVGPGGGWTFNPYFGLWTYLPYSGRYCDPFYGYCYWSPGYVTRLFYNPGGFYGGGGGGGAYRGLPSYTGRGGATPAAVARSGATGAASAMGGSPSSGMGGMAASSGGAAHGGSAAGASMGGSAGHGGGGSVGGGGGGGRGH